ncbi:MAG TPA: SAM-dependent methyltransferase, partial [Actinomycetota bacterium]|nr:SAM-dependent methyltransferase [Actinomycetota bacterium]
GCVIANELLDNLPFHRVRQTEHGLVELFVTTDGSRFALVEGPLSSPEVERASPRIRSAQEAVVNLGALRFVDDAASRLERGYVWLVDYGPEPGQPVSGVHGYRGHRAEGDILSAPGSRDITAGVDFAALAGHARDRGLHVWGPVAQREALLNLGFRDLDRRAQERQVEAVAARRGIDAMRIYSNRTRANLLLGRAGLGAFWVLCLGVGADVPPMSVRER